MNPFGCGDLEVEQVVLGCCVDGGREVTAGVIELVPLDAFIHPPFREAYLLLRQMLMDGEHIDLVTFSMAYRKQIGVPPLEVADCWNHVPFTEAWRHYAQPMLERRHQRTLGNAGASLTAASVDRSVDAAAAIEKAQEMIAGHGPSRHRYLLPAEASKALLADVSKRYDMRQQGKTSGILTGFVDLDRKTDGLQLGEQFVLGARPSQGKTALMLGMAEHIAVVGRTPCMIISLEMTAEALLRRLAASYARVPLANLKSGRMTKEDLEALPAATKAVADSVLHIVDAVNGITIEELVLKVRAQSRLRGIQVVFIDYLQKITPSTPKEKRTYEVAEVSQRLKALAASAGIALGTLAQLNREPDRDKGRQPRISDLADSSQIERDADAIALLHRVQTEEDPEGKNASLILAKQRDGETGIVRLFFHGQFCRFENAVGRTEDL